MTTYSTRFGVGDPSGLRSSEWVVMWKSDTSDVYLACRTLGGYLKASIHESGRCHIRAPDQRHWCSPGNPPQFLDVWSIDQQSHYQFPFGIIVPASELRQASWAKQKNKETTWLPATPGKSVEIAVFLTRAEPWPMDALASAGWTITLVLERLPDGRDLWVVAGEAIVSEERHRELDSLKEHIRPQMAKLPTVPLNPRLLLVATDGKGTRRFVEAAV